MKFFNLYLFSSVFFLLLSCNNNIKFESTEWKKWQESESSLGLRWKMHKDLLNNYNLKNYNKNQILDLLGKPDFETKNEFRYYLGYTKNGINTGTLIIIFDHNRVTHIKVING